MDSNSETMSLNKCVFLLSGFSQASGQTESQQTPRSHEPH